MATFNPFNPDGTWRWEVNGKDLEDLGIKAKAAGDAANAWARAGRKAEEPWNQWQSQKSPEELEAFNQWKHAYVKFNDVGAKPGENWFRQEWDRSETYYWFDMKNNPWYDGKDYEECLAFRHFFESGNTLNAREQEANWDSYGRAEWLANKSRPDAWKELLKQAERNRQQQKQERTWESYGGRKSYRDIFEEWKRATSGQQQSRPKLTVKLARKLILSNLDKFDAHYAEYWQRQRRMQMNEAKSKIGQLSIVHVPTIQQRFMSQCRQTGATEHEAAMLAETVWPPLSEKSEAYDNFVSRVMSPLFQWNQ